MSHLHAIAHDIFTVTIVIAVIGLWGYVKYRQLRSYTDQKNEKADVQTLFSGKK
jgi:hypothetical protein